MVATIQSHDLLDQVDSAEFQALTPAAVGLITALLAANTLNRSVATLALLQTVFPATTTTGAALAALFGGD